MKKPSLFPSSIDILLLISTFHLLSGVGLRKLSASLHLFLFYSILAFAGMPNNRNMFYSTAPLCQNLSQGLFFQKINSRALRGKLSFAGFPPARE